MRAQTENVFINALKVFPRVQIGTLFWAIIIWAFIIIFLIFPLFRIFYDAFTTEEGRITLLNFNSFFTDKFYLRSLYNSLLLGFAVVITSSVIGIAIAFILVRYDFPGRNLFSYLTLIPMIMPPLVGVMGFVFILGRAGTINVILMDYFGLTKPINFMYGLHGVLLVETLHLFPMITLNVVDALTKIDPSLEEAAESVGSRGFRKFWNITLPLTTPGYIAGALLVFIWTFADFATPLIVGVHDLLASQSYLNIVQFVDRRLFKMGIVISALMVLSAIFFLIIAKQYVALKDYSSLAYSKVERRKLSWKGKTFVLVFLSFIMLISFIPYIGITFASFGKAWALTPLPEKYTIQYFSRVSFETPKYIFNSFLYSGLAVVVCIVIGVPAAWLMTRTRIPGRGLLDSMMTLVLALPGTAIGIAYLRAFNVPLPFIGIPFTSMWLIMPVVLAMRRLPYTVRGSYASLLLVHTSLEEAAGSVGATRFKTFKDVTLPLIWKGVMVGSLFSFMTSLQEASATLFLFLPGWETIPIGIFTFYIAGSINEAAPLGFIMIILSVLSVIIVNKIAGTKMGGVFG